VVIRAAVVAALLLTGCGDKNRCNTNDDCNLGRTCDDSICTDAASLCSGTDCRATAVWPAVAASGDTVYIEGDFPDAVNVLFAGTTRSEPAARLGRHRLAVTVPNTVASGALTLLGASGTIGTVEPFRYASFEPSLGRMYVSASTTTLRPVPTLAHPRSGHCVVRLGAAVYVLGGVDASGRPVTTIERALANLDGSLGDFMPAGTFQRTGAACAVANGGVYIVGGDDGGTAPSYFVNLIGGTLTFHPLPPLPTPRSGAAAIVVGDKLYAIGGRSSNGPLTTVERASLTSDATLLDWQDAGTQLLTARSDAVVALNRDTIVVLGGNSAAGVEASIETARLSDTHIGAFQSTAMLSSPRANAAVLALGASLYLFGGASDETGIERLSLDDFSISPRPSVQLKNACLGAVAIPNGNFVHLIGGGAAQVQTLAFDAGTSPHAQSGSTPPEPGHSAAVVAAVGPNLYVIGGTGDFMSQDANLLGSVSVATVQDGEMQPFSTVAGLTLQTRRHSANAAVIGSWLYIIGGLSNSVANPDDLEQPVAAHTVERIAIDSDGNLVGSFSDAGTLVKPRGRASATIVGNTLYVIGGKAIDGTVATTTSIERATIAGGELGPFSVVNTTTQTARRGAATFTTDFGIYLFDGSDESDKPIPSDGEVLPFDSRGGLESSLKVPASSLPPVRIANAPVVTIGGIPRILAGFGQSPTQTSAFPQAVIQTPSFLGDGSLSIFTQKTLLGSSRNDPLAVVVDNWLYVFDGYAGFMRVTTPERAILGTP
jgi:N-acetylneuraminic acid mutarotase